MLSVDELRSILDYDPITGHLTWKIKKAVRVNIGDRAGSNNGRGYLKISIDNRKYFAHRIAWAIYYGEMPSTEIDHVNGDGNDNRISNMRLASRSENMRNTFLRSDNSSGYKGVCAVGKGTWRAQCQVNGRKKTIGYYKSPESAHVAYLEFIKSHHGNYANSGSGDTFRNNPSTADQRGEFQPGADHD